MSEAPASWKTMSLAEQLGNVGSEVHRARAGRARDRQLSQNAFERALELLDRTLSDARWRGRRKELARARELLVDAAQGGTTYKSTLEDLDHYFLYFAIAARNTVGQER
jgi:hypothetical protein